MGVSGKIMGGDAQGEPSPRVAASYTIDWVLLDFCGFVITSHNFTVYKLCEQPPKN